MPDETGIMSQSLCIGYDSSRSTSIVSGVAGAWPTCSVRRCPAMAPAAKPGCSSGRDRW